MLQSCQVELVIHCGDIGSTEIISLFQPWPTHFVFGNVDIPTQPLQRAIVAAGQTCHGRFKEIWKSTGVRSPSCTGTIRRR